MALPNFSVSAGLALIRLDPSNQWHFVCWITGGQAIAMEILSPGTHRYELWEIVGNMQSEVAEITYDGPVSLGVIQMHK